MSELFSPLLGDRMAHYHGTQQVETIDHYILKDYIVCKFNIDAKVEK